MSTPARSPVGRSRLSERLKDGLARPYAWATDGRLIFEEAGDIGMLTMKGERTVEMLLDTASPELEPALSPDGRWLAYISIDPEPPLIYVQPFPNVDGGLWNVSLDYGVQPVWSPNGRELFYRNQTDLMVAQVETEPTFSALAPEPLFSTSGQAVGGTPAEARTWDLAPEGDRFVFRRIGTPGQTSTAAFNGLIFVENWFQGLTERVPVP